MIEYDKCYYNRIINENGYIASDNINDFLMGFNMELINKWLCFYNFSEDIIKDIRKENTLFISGIGLNKEPHIGTITQILKMIEIQKIGYNTQIILGDLDCYSARKIDLGETKKNVEKYKKFIRKIGFSIKEGDIRTQYDHEEIMKTAFLISKFLSEKDFEDTIEDIYEYYEREKIIEKISFPIKMSILLMIADFIHYGYWGKIKHIIVISGIDEHMYVYKANEIAKRMNLDITISGMFSDLIKGFNNFPKMSKSLLNSSINVTMSLKEIEDIIFKDKEEYSVCEDSILFQIVKNTFFYNQKELKEISKFCLEKNERWEKLKVEVAQKLYDISLLWE